MIAHAVAAVCAAVTAKRVTGIVSRGGPDWRPRGAWAQSSESFCTPTLRSSAIFSPQA